MRINRRSSTLIVGLTLWGGCGSVSDQTLEPTDGQTDTGGTTSDQATLGADDLDPSPTTDGDADTDDATFFPTLDIEQGGETCSIWSQDCPHGEKCSPWSSDGAPSTNATHCVAVDANPAQPGDTCTVVGPISAGTDDCALGSLCWDVDPETNEGICVAMCEGSADAPLCSNPDTFCSITNEGLLALCLPECDPLLQSCDDSSHGCYLVNAEGFVCAPDFSGDNGVPGDPCNGTLNICDRGTQCVGATAVPGCVGVDSCCSSFCDLDEPDPGCLPQQECLAIFDPNNVPPGAESYGICAIPS